MIRSRARALAVAVAGTALAVVPGVALGVAGDFVQPATSPEAAGDSPNSIAAANLGGSASNDLAVANLLDDNVSILLGDGTGNFTAAGTETVGGQPSSVVAASFNGDANLDLAVANDNTDNVTILLGDGTGNFTEKAMTSPEMVGDAPSQLIATNLDGDANADLAVANSNDDTVSILLGDGTGNFTPFGTEMTGNVPGSLAFANLSGDVNPDLAVANIVDDNVTILLGDGTGNFDPAAMSPEGAGDAPRSVVTGSFGGTPSLDLAVANAGSDNVSILLGDGTGNFTAAGTSPEAVGDAPISVFNAPGVTGTSAPALVVANSGDDNVSILLGDLSTGNFTPAGTSPETVGASPVSFAGAQFGGDSAVDLAVANSDSDDVSILLNDRNTPPATPPVVPPAITPTQTSTAPTGLRGAALKKCKKKRGRARRNCKRKANKLPL